MRGAKNMAGAQRMKGARDIMQGILARMAFVAIVCSAVVLTACAGTASNTTTTNEDSYLTFVDVDVESVDPQCIIENYTVPLNVFDRLVEYEKRGDDTVLVPSLAQTWERSDDGLTYSFSLREGATFSNGAAITASDVKFSLERLLTNPKSRHADLAIDIVGARELAEGSAKNLAGFAIEDDHHFTITLERPAATFLAGLSTPAASILDEETTRNAGEAFGHDVEHTVGSGPFQLESWTPGKSIIMRANPTHWDGPPACAGLKMQFFSENTSLRDLYAEDKLDILDLDKLGMESEYFMRGDIYLRNLARGRRVGITYIALNNSMAPLDDVRVRRALTLALDRSSILVGSIGGRGTVENGILPRGLLGHNNTLEEIPYDPDQARQLLAEAGFADGFDLVVTCPSNASQIVRDLLRLATSLWSDIGVRARIEEVDPATFSSKRSAGELSCYTSSFSADYNDPQNFMDTFFGGREATNGRSICYQDDATMQRVLDARYIVDEAERIRAYQDLEKKIVQEDCAWIPLYSKMHLFVVSDRVEDFEVRWNGWSSNRYDKVSIKGGEA